MTSIFGEPTFEASVAVRNPVEAMWLTGTKYPDYKRIGRFIQRNREGSKRAFEACARMPYEAGLVEMVLHVVDGTKVAAEGSRGKSIRRADLEATGRGSGGGSGEVEASFEEGMLYGVSEDLQGEREMEAFFQERRMLTSGSITFADTCELHLSLSKMLKPGIAEKWQVSWKAALPASKLRIQLLRA